MGEQLFDELARALTTSMPRRRAVSVIAGALASGVLGRPRRALAANAICSGGSVCTATEYPGTSKPYACCYPSNPVCCHDSRGAWCCFAGQSCGGGGGPNCVCPAGTQVCGAGCCPAGEKCVSGKCEKPRCPPKYTRCGDRCCGPEQVCSGDRCSGPCPSGTTRCGTDCCSKHEQCTSIRVGPSSARVCVPRCPQGQALCGGRCCPKNWRCANPKTGVCKKCATGQEECGKKCCPTGQFCCNPEKGTCCKKKRESCCFAGPPNKVSAICCQAGTECAPLGGAQGPLDGLPQYVCCPPTRVVPLSGGGSLCCPPGYRSLGGKLVVVAGGGGGLCCREGNTCGSGKDVTCCASGTALVPEFRQICCDGRCVSSMVDPQNCGGCGKVCASGQCKGGVCV